MSLPFIEIHLAAFSNSIGYQVGIFLANSADISYEGHYIVHV